MSSDPVLPTFPPSETWHLLSFRPTGHLGPCLPPWLGGSRGSSDDGNCSNAQRPPTNTPHPQSDVLVKFLQVLQGGPKEIATKAMDELASPRQDWRNADGTGSLALTVAGMQVYWEAFWQQGVITPKAVASGTVREADGYPCHWSVAAMPGCWCSAVAGTPAPLQHQPCRS